MYLAIDFWLWVLGIWGVSQVAWLYYSRTRSEFVRACLNMFAFLGVIVHEFSHFFVSLLCGMPVYQIRIKWRSEYGPWVAPHGSVATGDFPRRTFMKGFLICFAPLLIATFLVFVCIDVICNIQSDLIVNVIAGIVAVSVVLAAAPSGQDLSNLGRSVANDLVLALGQMACFSLSTIITIQFVNFSHLQFPFEFIYYAIYFVGGLVLYCIIFHGFRLTGLGMKKLLNITFTSNRSRLRKRIRPIKEERLRRRDWW